MALYISLRSRLTSPSSSILLIRHLLPSSTSAHSFTSNSPTHEDKQPPRPHLLNRHRNPCVSVMDPFTSRRSVGQLLQMMEQLMENPLASGGGGGRRGWDVREDEEALYLKMEMPGLGKEQVKVYVENNTMVIKGEMEEKEEEEEDKRRYSSRIDLPNKVYKVDDIKAEMKNGVLKVVVPKLKEEERAADVLHVQVE